MINKFEIIFGVLFLLVMIGSISGSTFDWAIYGGNLQPFKQAQFPNAIGNFSLGNNLYNNITTGINLDSSANAFTPFQPIISDLNGTQEYIVVQNGNYIEVYNQNLVLFQEINSGSGLSQLAVTDFNNDGYRNDIAGVWEINDTLWYFGVYSFNATTFSSSLIYQKNYTGNSTKKISGVRCVTANCYFINSGTNTTIYNQTFEHITMLSSNSFQLPNTNQTSYEYYEEPLSFTDVDGDGNLEFLTFSKHKVILFRQDGTILWTYNVTDTPYRNIISAKLFHPDSTNIWKIAILEGRGASGENSQTFLTIKRADGSNLWTKTITYGLSQNYVSGGLAIGDYDGDFFDDVYYLAVTDHFTSNFINGASLFIFRGNDGTPLISKNFTDLGWNENHLLLHNFGFTIANLNSGSKQDYLMNWNNHIFAFDIFNNQTLLSFNATQQFYSCIPADVLFRGTLDIICSGTGGTGILYTNFTNQPPTINSVSYDPSTLIAKNSQVNAFVSAIDPEGNVILYRHNCFDGDIFSAESTSSVQSCYYTNAGTYNMTIEIRDGYHFDYFSFSQLITVTETGAFCNNNGTCDSILGETTINCPNDCPSTPNVQQSSDTGGTPIPTEIVSTSNINEGLLPEIYFGTIGFLSNTIQPVIILVFMIFFVLIILAIAFIIRKIGQKVGDLSK